MAALPTELSWAGDVRKERETEKVEFTLRRVWRAQGASGSWLGFLSCPPPPPPHSGGPAGELRGDNGHGDDFTLQQCEEQPPPPPPPNPLSAPESRAAPSLLDGKSPPLAASPPPPDHLRLLRGRSVLPTHSLARPPAGRPQRTKERNPSPETTRPVPWNGGNGNPAVRPTGPARRKCL